MKSILLFILGYSTNTFMSTCLNADSLPVVVIITEETTSGHINILLFLFLLLLLGLSSGGSLRSSGGGGGSSTNTYTSTCQQSTAYREQPGSRGDPSHHSWQRTRQSSRQQSCCRTSPRWHRGSPSTHKKSEKGNYGDLDLSVSEDQSGKGDNELLSLNSGHLVEHGNVDYYTTISLSGHFQGVLPSI